MSDKCGCGTNCCGDNIKKEKWITGYLDTKIGKIPRISNHLSFADKLGHFGARFGYNRMNYKIEPGLYASGNPDENAKVFVTANYKMTFDKLRKDLNGIDSWVLVLDTKGINVWCAAGKGTFGTKELINRVIETKLLKLISHNDIILPQLGAVGVDADAVKINTALRVIYGPVYSKDIKKFINNKYKKDDRMRIINFNFFERLAVAPLELVQAWKFLLIALAVSAVFSLIDLNFTFNGIVSYFIPFAGSIIIGTLFFPLLLPIIPFRSFALKGAVLGILWSVIISIFYKLTLPLLFVNILLMTPIISFLSLNFTGATTYTCITGAKLEVKYSLPVMMISILSGLILKALTVFKILI